jgi:hypothetical protein
MATPLGDTAATIAAIGRGVRAGARDPASGLVVARLAGTPPATRHARLVGALPALALEAARVAAREVPRGPRAGAFVATGGLRAQWEALAPAMAEQAAGGANAWARGLSRMPPLWMLRYLSNAAHAIVAAELGAIGDGATFAGPTSAASALVAAGAALACGAIDHAIVVALDDVTADEVARELHARAPDVIPGAAVAAIAVARAAGGVQLDAVDGVDPEHAEPSPAAIASVRARLPRAERDVSFAAATGWLGAAGLLVDAIVAAELVRTGGSLSTAARAPRSVTITAAASPGQIGVVRVEAAA